jgi:hypothetical protein
MLYLWTDWCRKNLHHEPTVTILGTGDVRVKKESKVGCQHYEIKIKEAQCRRVVLCIPVKDYQYFGRTIRNICHSYGCNKRRCKLLTQ